MTDFQIGSLFLYFIYNNQVDNRITKIVILLSVFMYNYYDFQLLRVHVERSRSYFFHNDNITRTRRACPAILFLSQNGPQWARKFKKVQSKKIKQINFTKKFLDQIPYFTISKMAKNQFLNWGKRFKSAKKYNFTKKNYLFDLISQGLFFPGLF